MYIVAQHAKVWGKILHTRNQHLRNHHGLSMPFPNGFSAAFQTEFHCSAVLSKGLSLAQWENGRTPIVSESSKPPASPGCRCTARSWCPRPSAGEPWSRRCVLSFADTAGRLSYSIWWVSCYLSTPYHNLTGISPELTGISQECAWSHHDTFFGRWSQRGLVWGWGCSRGL